LALCCHLLFILLLCHSGLFRENPMLKKGRSFRHHSFCKMALIAALAPLPLLAAPLPGSAKVDFEFELPKIDTSMYARPYVAVWVED